jgi:hypothetical protein
MIRLLCLLCLPSFLLVHPAASTGATPILTVQGEEIPLGGTATGSAIVYLFLTGPNLPDGGISLVGGIPVATGDPASFTRVEVLTGDTWAYRWRTGDLGRVLDPGTYVIYAAGEPLARPDLDDAPYTTQSVLFGPPVETLPATLPAEGGSLAVNSTPGKAAVTLDGHSVGATPLSISGLSPGPHTLVISREGYADYRADLVLSAGERREISAVLEPLPPIPSTAGTLPPVTIPAGRLPLPIVVPVGAAALALLGFRRRR